MACLQGRPFGPSAELLINQIGGARRACPKVVYRFWTNVRAERSQEPLWLMALCDISNPDIAPIVAEQENDLVAGDDGRGGTDHRRHDCLRQREHVDLL